MVAVSSRRNFICFDLGRPSAPPSWRVRTRPLSFVSLRLDRCGRRAHPFTQVRTLTPHLLRHLPRERERAPPAAVDGLWVVWGGWRWAEACYCRLCGPRDLRAVPSSPRPRHTRRRGLIESFCRCARQFFRFSSRRCEHQRETAPDRHHLPSCRSEGGERSRRSPLFGEGKIEGQPCRRDLQQALALLHRSPGFLVPGLLSPSSLSKKAHRGMITRPFLRPVQHTLHCRDHLLSCGVSNSSRLRAIRHRHPRRSRRDRARARRTFIGDARGSPSPARTASTAPAPRRAMRLRDNASPATVERRGDSEDRSPRSDVLLLRHFLGER